MTIEMGLEKFVPVISQWKLQSENDIYDSFNDWDLHSFICLMKDGKETTATGICDEDSLGFCSKYVDIEGSYETDDILFWTEVPTTPSTDTIEVYGKEKVANAIKDYDDQFRLELIKELKAKIETLEKQQKEMRCCGNCEHREDCVYEWAWDLCEKWGMYKNGISSDAKRS